MLIPQETFIHLTSLFWRVKPDDNHVHLTFEIPMKYESRTVEMISEMTVILSSVITENGFSIKEEGIENIGNEMRIECSFTREDQITNNLLRIQNDLEKQDWYVDLIPSLSI